MTVITEILSAVPKGHRVGGAASDAVEVKSRKLAVAGKILAASLCNQMLYQKAHLSQLPECTVMKTTRWLGDFVGGGRAGLSLDLERSGNDWLIRPSPCQAARAWEWIRKYAKEDMPRIAELNGFATEAELENRIAGDLATSLQKPGEGSAQPE